jgi:hypothetical protein
MVSPDAKLTMVNLDSGRNETEVTGLSYRGDGVPEIVVVRKISLFWSTCMSESCDFSWILSFWVNRWP